MLRRISIAILATVALTLLVCGSLTYWSVRNVLLHNLDATLLQRAASLHQITDEAGNVLEQAVAQAADDRSIVRNEKSQTLSRNPSVGYGKAPSILSARFASLEDGSRVRTLQIQTYVRPTADSSPQPVTIIYSGSAREFDSQMRAILLASIASVIAGGAVAVILARWLSRRALQPLQSTADAIASIDIASLDRRVPVESLPRELGPMAQNLNTMLQRIESGVASQKRFLDSAAHELRTPVASMLLTAELETASASPETRTKFGSILAQARVLKRLVESLMNAARANRETPEEPEPIDLKLLLQSIQTTMTPLASRKSSTVSVCANGELIALAPPLLLRRAVTNLISNAIEHNPNGTAVDVALSGRGAEGVITVSDNGVGIDQDHISKLTTPYFQVAPDTDSGHMGLGLAIVGSAVEKMGGRLAIHSAPGQGSRFEIQIPLYTEEPA